MYKQSANNCGHIWTRQMWYFLCFYDFTTGDMVFERHQSNTCDIEAMVNIFKHMKTSNTQ